jgi:hypothetical protein
MRIGDLVTWNGRRYVVRGVDPMGLSERRADLEDPETGELVRVPVGEVEPA